MKTEEQINAQLNFTKSEFDKLKPSKNTEDWNNHTWFLFGNITALCAILDKIEVKH
jgi:hypothetical protein